MRNGYWIILDELNLAPTDVLEALNRLLDDNRELFIAETSRLSQLIPGFYCLLLRTLQDCMEAERYAQYAQVLILAKGYDIE